ncbi:serine/threonine-protein kinase [Streptomyces sp. NPDC047725]|uniref:serine/threonine-protein kinase n=1 Tax=Streptomyces sp. NPDC047725 TaxID=3365487 RepID=UPI003717B79A
MTREARHAARLRDHRNIGTVYDALRERGGDPWIVMQYVAGCSLAEELRKRGRLPVDEVERVAAGALTGLAAAHAAGIVQRDVKPANVLLSTDRRVMLSDFGIALAATDTALTAEGVVIGTPGYLAPELWRGTKPGAPADLFALGVTLYEAVEGEPPFPRHNPTAALTDPSLPPDPRRATRAPPGGPAGEGPRPATRRRQRPRPGDNGMRARTLAWGLEADKLPEKYKIERITAQQKAEYQQAVTAPDELEPTFTP